MISSRDTEWRPISSKSTHFHTMGSCSGISPFDCLPDCASSPKRKWTDPRFEEPVLRDVTFLVVTGELRRGSSDHNSVSAQFE